MLLLYKVINYRSRGLPRSALANLPYLILLYYPIYYHISQYIEGLYYITHNIKSFILYQYIAII